MEGLSFNWLTSKLIDAEYKKYVLLAYLKKVGGRFRENRLYPYYENLKQHYRNLWLIHSRKNSLSEQFPQELEGIDLEEFRLKYRKGVVDDELMEEIDKIVQEALPDIRFYLREGEKLRSTVLKAIKLRPVGVIPIYRMEGYLFLRKNLETRVYHYHVSNIHDPDHSRRYRRIRTRFLDARYQEIHPSFESIKEALVRKNPDLPNPAVFAVETELDIPHVQTLLPVAKQVLTGWITKNPGGEGKENSTH